MQRWILPVLLLATALGALGNEFPLTNTRYGAVYGKPQLVSNGRDFFLFWNDREKIRATKLRDGDTRGGHVVLDAAEDFDVAWNGSAFVVVGFRNNQVPYGPVIVSRLLDADARPAGAEVTVTEGRSPRIAVDRESMLLLYQTLNTQTINYEIRSLLLGIDGRTTLQESQPVIPNAAFYDVASNGNGFVAVTGGADVRVKKLSGRGLVLSESTLNPSRTLQDLAIAGNQTDYLVTWCAGGEVVALPFSEESARLGPRQTLESSTEGLLFEDASIVGDAGGWSVAYTEWDGRTPRVRITHLDREVHAVTGRESVDEGGSPSIAALNGRTLAAWNPINDLYHATYPPTFVSALPLAQNQPRAATYAAAQQRLMGTATSAEGTLLVWHETLGESRTIHAGVRGRNGDWHEQLLATADLYAGLGGSPLVTASNGQGFVVMYRSGSSYYMRLLNEIGQPVSAEQLVSGIAPRAAVWNGENYAVLGAIWQGGPGHAIAMLSRDGQWGPPVRIDISEYAAHPALASDGNGYLVTWERADNCDDLSAGLPCISTALRGTRLGSDLRRLDATDLAFSDIPSVNTGVVRSGSEYVAAWVDFEQAIGVAGVPSSGAAIRIRKNIDVPANSLTGSVAATRDGAAFALSDRLLLLDRNQALTARVSFEGVNVQSSIPLALGLPDGSAAYAVSSVQEAAPHHGTSHVMMGVVAASPIAPPEAPRPLARVEDGRVLVEWSGGAGTVNGYRLEYRIDDGSWNELDRWFAPGDQNLVFGTVRPGATYAFRVRAFNDGGARDSEAAYINVGRRRAAGR
jgi:fibronectin type III domain protein